MTRDFRNGVRDFFEKAEIPSEPVLSSVEGVEGIFMFFVYILRTSSDTLYIGQTNNLEKRLKEHKNKSSKSAKYIRYFTSFHLVYSETYASRKEAMHREHQLKKWSRAKKETLIRLRGESEVSSFDTLRMVSKVEPQTSEGM